MKLTQIAFRNIFRNARRSLMTVLAIAVSAISILIFGGYVSAIIYGMQTDSVQKTGHLHLYRKGYFDYGAGNPGAYGISRYGQLIQMILQDPLLKEHVLIATPIVKLYGIVGNFSADVSKTFFGIGFVPSDFEKMSKWNDYGMSRSFETKIELSDADTEGGIIGEGLARILLLCDELKVTHCREKPPDKTEGMPVTEDFRALTEAETQIRMPENNDLRPRLDLLAATAGGAPNVVSLYVHQAENKGVKELDDNYVAMHILLAQRLLYGNGEKKATGIILQLRHTRDIPFVRACLLQMISENDLDLDVKDFTQMVPLYNQVISMFATIFTFLAIIMGIIVLFTITNTMTMSVMERVNEIGTIRALGIRRGGILRLFITEGCILGILGTSLGTAASVLIAFAINASGITWIPPNYVEPVLLTILLFENSILIPICWVALVLLAIISSLIPARKAGRMVIVDALRHV